MRKRPKPYHAEHLDEIDDLKVVKRLLAKVKISLTRGFEGLPEWCWGCWEFTGYLDKKFYGQIKYCGRAHWTHRIAYAIWRGTIRRRKTVNHQCFNPSCCNPFHLELMSHRKNSAMKKPKTP